jgi:hypothetical protein
MQRIHARNLYIGTTAERTTLSASLPTDGIGATYYDTDDGNIYFWDGTIWISFGSGSGAAAFVDLTDVPASYTGASGKLVKVKADETGLEFVSPSAGSGDVTGPEGSAVGNLSTFADSTGKTLSDSGIAISDLEPARGADDNYVTAAEKTIIGNTSGTNTGDQVGDGTTITGTGTAGDPFVASASGSGSGDVVGPAGATDGHLAVFDGATGKLLRDGGTVPTGGASNFVDLGDVPATYAGAGGKTVAVKSDESGIEFIDPVPGGSSGVVLVSTDTATGASPHSLDTTNIQEGDVVIAAISTRNSVAGVISGGSAWNELYYEDVSSDEEIRVFWKVAGASEPATYSWVHTSGALAASAIVIYRNLDGTLISYGDNRLGRSSPSILGSTNGLHIIVMQCCYQASVNLVLQDPTGIVDIDVNCNNGDQAILIGSRNANFPAAVPSFTFSGGNGAYIVAGAIVIE